MTLYYPNIPTGTPFGVAQELRKIAEAFRQVEAAPGGGGGGSGWTLVLKPEDTSRSLTTTLDNDPHLIVNLTAGTTYAIRGRVRITQTTQEPDVRYALAFSGSTSSVFCNHGYDALTTPGNMNTPSSLTGFVASGESLPTGVAVLSNNAGTLTVFFDVAITPATSGVFGFAWTQNAAHPAAVIARAGSYFEWSTAS